MKHTLLTTIIAALFLSSCATYKHQAYRVAISNNKPPMGCKRIGQVKGVRAIMKIQAQKLGANYIQLNKTHTSGNAYVCVPSKVGL